MQARECWKLQVLLLASCPALTDDALADLAGAQQTTGRYDHMNSQAWLL